MNISMKTEAVKLSDYFATSDLSLATTLSLWYPLDSIDKSVPRAQFLFKRDQELDKLVESYRRGELRIEPKAYASQLKIIKTRLYSNT